MDLEDHQGCNFQDLGHILDFTFCGFYGLQSLNKDKAIFANLWWFVGGEKKACVN